MTASRNRCGGLAVIWLLVLVNLAPVCLAAEETAVQEPADRIPRLGEHRFTPNTLTGDPFIRTYVRNSLGIGKALDLYVPVIEIDGEPVWGLKGDLLNAILEFEFQQEVKDWVAFRARVRVLGRLGTGAQSLLAQGISANMAFEFGWMFKLSEGEKTALSGTVNILNNSVTAIDPLGFVNGVVEGTNTPLVRTIPVTRVGVGLRYAWAVSELVGLNFLGQLGYGESIDRLQGDEWSSKLSAAIDFDLRTKTVLPFGVALAYLLNSSPGTGNEVTNMLNAAVLRVTYTGTTDFLISLDLYNGWYKQGELGQTVNLAATLVSLRYYF